MAKKKATRKKASRKTAAPKVDPKAREQVVLMLVAGIQPEAAEAAARDRLKLTAAAATATLAAAQHAILLAASVDRRRQLGISIKRLDDLYQRALKIADNRVALQTQKELNRLLDLAHLSEAGADADGSPAEAPEARELKAVADHLLPLGLAAADYPLREHARIAADRIRREAA